LTRAYNAANQWIGYRDAQETLVGTSLFAYDGNGNPTTYTGATLTYNAPTTTHRQTSALPVASR